MTTTSQAAGWHPDPDGVYQYRYHDGVGWTLHVADNGVTSQAPLAGVPQPPPPPPPGSAPIAGTGAVPAEDAQALRRFAEEYGRACSNMLTSIEAALRVANDATATRNMAEKRPQHEISIRNFADMASRLEEEFAPLYRAFDNARALAKEAGARLVAGCRNSDPEVVLLASLDPQTYSETGAAVEYLRAPFGPTPRAFVAAVKAGNAAISSAPDFGEPAFRGHVYR
ncbi:hypothetical protein Val02_08860 [Virgisporangium aliadipatigenens]|uniref:DUF2510 domain-containing protein n=1 Tax=Virgisporangium aliadipatigenens TaxID=741659 RepID=A0A8J3YHA5_9ACTN|nr:DUF2510 domain-containing protein [Virgisporangium aliadipatigenens]GIJ44000.1 hypothetical protein Val02_08860 [Virgisporangium aliadipatigenens]